MEFQINLKKGSCRLGNLVIKEVKFKTPMCLMYTRLGTVPHIATYDDLLPKNDKAFQLTLSTFVDLRSTEVVKMLDGGVHSFIGNQSVNIVTVQDPAREPPSGYNLNKAVSVWTAGGRRKIDVQQFLSIVETFRPDVVECLCDTIPSSGQTAKRIQKSVDRTLKFLEEIVQHKEKDKKSQYHLLGVVEGSNSITERQRSAKDTAKHPVSGFVLEGFRGCDDNWEKVLQAATAELPDNKPRFIQGISTPDDVVKAIECGIDVFDSSFPCQVAERGCALIFPTKNKRFKVDDNVTSSHHFSKDDCQNSDCSENKYEINLNDPSFSKDLRPVDKCTCYCCTNHSRAYIHHLLVTKEMLAQVLLMTHNVHQYCKFFDDIRQALTEGCWEDFKDRFCERDH